MSPAVAPGSSPANKTSTYSHTMYFGMLYLHLETSEIQLPAYIVTPAHLKKVACMKCQHVIPFIQVTLY